ncbi:hypothetical protein Rumeso_04980 [Rubellimicrobium mesophilum DSM 19309]|uniref:HIRAN domain-containing protein n=1 Tax=Rubellimicrobium mesophilum DSM 19309 TaxID=442562 RepID=A0A017HCT7_9RHOB|nr:hypothetical protein [Rubellimicrobium mesophilum]EYD71579.1 hypothetical protein Rumeso_04980 [Rubellimicrobium mesophilum DSM 19309]
MDVTELDIGGAPAEPRTSPRRAALDALERLLRAHQALREQRTPEGPHGLLRPAREDEADLIEAVFHHCGVPLPDTLRAIYRRTLGIGNPVSRLPVLAAPFLRAALPDEGFGCPVVGLEALEDELGLHRDDGEDERPPFLVLGHAAPLGLMVGRNGLWSLGDPQAGRDRPDPRGFDLVFETAFRTYVDQVLLLWANDLAGDIVRPRDLDLTRGARLTDMPAELRKALARLAAPRPLGPRTWGDIQPLDNADLLRATRRGETSAGPLDPQIAVVGLPYGDRPEIVGQIAPGTRLRLRPVDDNPHDPNAVEVWHDRDTPIRVGFVARRDAPHVRALPQGAEAWRLRVAASSDSVLYAALEMRRPEDDLPSDAQGEGPDLTSHGQSRDLFSRGT